MNISETLRSRNQDFDVANCGIRHAKSNLWTQKLSQSAGVL